MMLWIYAIANRWDPDSDAWQLPVLVIAQLLAGLAVHRWWAVLLPVVVVIVSIPAGYPPITVDNAEPLPIWFGLAVAAPVAILLVALGVAARKIYDRRSSPAWLTT
jgi:hypothetical protein